MVRFARHSYTIRKRMMRLVRRICGFLTRLCIATLVVSLFFVVTQDFHIFPGLYPSIIFGYTSTAPTGVEVLTAVAADGSVVNIWRVRALKTSQRAVALLFHGNAEHLERFERVQNWLSTLGISSYSVEYRGFNGRHSGWPSEKGFYLDAEAALEFLVRQERVESDKIIVFGSSIGTGIATHVAQKFTPGTLVLLSPYTSLTDLIKEMPLFGYLAPFVKYRFPNDENISLLTSTCVVAAHGVLDTTIPLYHSERLKARYRGTKAFRVIVSPNAGHNDLMAHTHKEIAEAIDACLKGVSTPS